MISMKKQVIQLLLISIVSAMPWQVSGQEIQNPKLSKEIRKMQDTDRKLRNKWAKMAKSGKTENKKFKKLTDEVLAVDSLNTSRMKEIVMQFGWPTYQLVGKKASVGAWLIVQHADRDPLFQIKCLPLLKVASEQGQSDPVNYAFLYDRIQIAKGEKQLYATQSTTNNGITDGYFQPIEDEANIQNRRAEKGFDLHVESYAQKNGFVYKIPSKKEALERSNAFAKAYKENIMKAKEAISSGNYDDAVVHYQKALESNGSLKTEDFIETARCISLAKHKESKWAANYLIQAVIRGYENGEGFLTHPDFGYLKRISPRNWNNLKRVISQSKKS